MAIHYVNKNAQTNGDHEVHVASCAFFPSDTVNLGDHATCHTAVAAAKAYYAQSNGCFYCCNACHTS